MRNLMLASAAALAFTAAPAISQDTNPAQDVTIHATSDRVTMNASQTAMYETWAPERRTMYDSWPYGVQEYYWTLQPTQVDGWWMLDDSQRLAIYGMTPAQRTAAWAQVGAQMGNSTSMAATTSASMAGGPRFVSNAVVQTTPASTMAAGGEYPPCKGNMQDSCINPREAGLNYGNRPLQYWPGKPASKM